MAKPKPKPNAGGANLKSYSKGNKAMTPKQQYKLAKQSNRYSYKENTGQIRASTQKTVARTGMGTVGATSAGDSLAEATQKSTKEQQDQNIYIYDQAAQGFLPSSSDPNHVIDDESLSGKTSEITPEGLSKRI